MVVDEAQFAKNHLSLAANSLRKLQTKTFFCLTGTPLENHLGDLWSLLDLILPGYAGSRKSFLSRFKNPDKESLDLLRKKLSPVLIRRRRSEVLTELPPRSDENIVIPMEKEQALLYEATRMEAVLVLQNAGRDYLMKMLPYLTKLRRIACHPDLGKTKAAQTINQLKKDTPKNLSASGKFSWFTEEKEKLESSSEGILVFSQFTDVLDLFEKLLTNSGSSWFRIDGTTPAKKRTESVKRFQEGEGRYFLISLKAGGSALTLNRADTVIHLDPWWNPAAEEQATARAHRMGQKNRVMVYRYISEGTIEEKVVKLQEIKRNLFRDVLDHPEAAGASSVSRAELEELLS